MNIEITIDGTTYIAVPKEEQTLKAEPKPFPQVGDKYESINTHGKILNSVWYDDVTDFARKVIGNVYRVGEAQKALDKLKAWARINDYIDANGLRFDESNGLDWKDENQMKWMWKYGYHAAGIEMDYACQCQFSDNPVFRTKDDLQKVIDACKHDILIVMGVK